MNTADLPTTGAPDAPELAATLDRLTLLWLAHPEHPAAELRLRQLDTLHAALTGDPDGAAARAETAILASLRDRLQTRIHVDPDTGCWLWAGTIHPKGYGQVSINGRDLYVHRVVYEWTVGPIPDGLTIDHLCRRPPCCHPGHLEPVTVAENIRRGTSPSAANARKTECHRGHPLAGANLYRTPDGRRKCRACQRARAASSTDQPQEGNR